MSSWTFRSRTTLFLSILLSSCLYFLSSFKGLLSSLTNAHLVSQRSWIRIPFRPEFFQALITPLLKLCAITAMSYTVRVKIKKYPYMRWCWKLLLLELLERCLLEKWKTILKSLPYDPGIDLLKTKSDRKSNNFRC